MSITRYELMMYLKTTSALHSGGVEETVNREDPETKQERKATAQRFARDGQGQPCLPGRSIKGAIRAACEQTVARADGAIDEDGLLTKDSLKALWGGESAASVLTVHPIVLPESDVLSPEWEKRDDEERRCGLRNRPGIAIDRYWGAVGDGALFVHEVLPAGAELKLRISAHVDTESGRTPKQVEALLRLIVELFKAEQITFGKRKGAGWGGVTLTQDSPEKSASLTRTNLDTPDGLLSWLSGGEKLPLEELPAIESVSDAQERLTIRVEWSSPTGILVADVERYEHELTKKKKECEESRQKTGEPEECEPVHLRQLAELSKVGAETLIIPGSSIRGALRNRATRIARTILFATEGAGGEYTSDWSDEDVHKQLATDVPLIHDLFGTTDRRGALTVREVKSEGELGKLRTVTHNAGDRWTGGVIDGGLYSEEYYVDTDWEPIVLEINLAHLFRVKEGERIPATYTEGRCRAALVLLGLVMAELATGTLPIGSRATRGMGAVEVSRIAVEGPMELLGEPWELVAADGQAIARELLGKLRDINADIDGNWTDYLTLPARAAGLSGHDSGEEQA